MGSLKHSIHPHLMRVHLDLRKYVRQYAEPAPTRPTSVSTKPPSIQLYEYPFESTIIGGDDDIIYIITQSFYF